MQNYVKKIVLTCAMLAVSFSVTKAQEKLSSSKLLSIMAWAGIPEAETNAERFNELKEMGINVTFINYPNAGAIQWALDLAQQLVIKNKKWKLDNHVD